MVTGLRTVQNTWPLVSISNRTRDIKSWKIGFSHWAFWNILITRSTYALWLVDDYGSLDPAICQSATFPYGDVLKIKYRKTIRHNLWVRKQYFTRNRENYSRWSCTCKCQFPWQISGMCCSGGTSFSTPSLIKVSKQYEYCNVNSWLERL